MRRGRGLAAVVVLGMGVFIPAPSRAAHCPPVVILSRAAVADTGPSVNAHAFACLVPGETHDTRYLNPGSNQINVRYDPPASFTQPSISGTVSVFGVVRSITLVRTEVLEGFPVYELAKWISIDPLATGSITATLSLTGSPTTTYRTFAVRAGAVPVPR